MDNIIMHDSQISIESLSLVKVGGPGTYHGNVDYDAQKRCTCVLVVMSDGHHAIWRGHRPA